MANNRATIHSSGRTSHPSSDAGACDGLIATVGAGPDAGAGGLLTVFDTEESPLSKGKAAFGGPRGSAMEQKRHSRQLTG